MTTKHRVVDDLVTDLKDAFAYMNGDMSAAVRVHHINIPAEVDVRAVRRRSGLSQEAFARRCGFALTALRDREQGRRRLERSARVLLHVIEREPGAVGPASGASAAA